MACDCATRPPILYWLKDGIWQEAEKKADRQLGHSCVRCVEHAMGRSLTLHDLDVAGYRKTIKPNTYIRSAGSSCDIGVAGRRREAVRGVTTGRRRCARRPIAKAI